MININGKNIKLEKFGDKTLKCECVDVDVKFGNIIEIMWLYDNDSELFALQCIIDDLRENYDNPNLYLIMPYIPHARQDRKTGNKLFTLKTFAKIINSMKFTKVIVNDAHSDVSCALIDKLYEKNILNIDNIRDGKDYGFDPNYMQIMFPDYGAAKRYGAKNCDIIGNKKRNNDGRIESYELIGLKDTTKLVIFIDDIISYGGTFVSAAQELKKCGVEHIVLFISHCEDNIIKGNVFNYADIIYTTDDILHYDDIIKEYPEIKNKIKLIRKYRNEGENKNEY